VRLHFCGVRGSTPAPGPAFVRYGGNTSCVAVARGDEIPRLILDAGTGLPAVSALLGGAPFRGTILLGHLHWDHTHGLPFFFSAARADAQVTLLMPEQGDAEAVLAGAMSPPHFPVRPSQLDGNWTFRGIETGWHDIEGTRVLALDLPHPGGRMFGYRIEDGAGVFTYISDHAPIALGSGPDGFGEYHEDVLTLAEGADTLIHDAQYLAPEFPSMARFGHSAVDYAVGVAIAAGVRRLVLFHHAPGRTDDEVDRLLEGARAAAGKHGLVVEAAAEGMVLEVPSQPA
jgi:ribonuclease BN (tRNA processing enzyme)